VVREDEQTVSADQPSTVAEEPTATNEDPFQKLLLASLASIAPVAETSDWKALAESATQLETLATAHGRMAVAESVRPLIELCRRDEHDGDLIRQSLSNFLTITKTFSNEQQPVVTPANVEPVEASIPDVEMPAPEVNARVPQATQMVDRAKLPGESNPAVEQGSTSSMRLPEETVHIDASRTIHSTSKDQTEMSENPQAPVPSKSKAVFVVELQQGLIEFQKAWDADDSLEAIAVAQRLKSGCDQAGKSELSNSLDALIRAAVDENQSSYTQAVKMFLDACRAEFTATARFDQEAYKKRQTLKVLSSVGDAHDPLLSTLPMDDEAFREIAIDFVPQLESKLRDMDTAMAANDLTEVACIAHWLKGAGGTCGFNEFTEPSTKLESAAKENDAPSCVKLIDLLWYMGTQIVIEPAETLANEI